MLVRADMTIDSGTSSSETSSKRPLIGITMGDPAGIGPEIVVKALADQEIRSLARFVIFGLHETLTYAADVSDTNIRVNLIDPGATRTDMRAEAYPSEDPMTLKSPEDLTDLFVDLASPECTRHGEIVYGY